MRPDITLPSSTEPLRSTSPQNFSSAHESSSSRIASFGPQDKSPDSESSVKVEEDTSVIDAFGTLTIGQQGESQFHGKTARSEYLIFKLTSP
ncbi:hypothetical protein BDQ17DRAFT_1435766 [Cyathus striatus]|nr:hypothetical protein BDQ17DRAFT_1435766 [Cyathus striatus]